MSIGSVSRSSSERARWGAVGRRAALAAALAAVVAAAACGHRMDLPEETRGGVIPASGTYFVKQVWEGFEGAQDIVLTSGSQVYVSFPDSGRVVGYFSTGSTPKPNGKVLEGDTPTWIAEGANRTLIVADRDSAGLVVHVFDQATTEQVLAFRDTSWIDIGGVAADASGSFYVSDRQANRVRKYDATGAFILELANEGTGIGYVEAPAALHWHPDQVLVVDGGKQWVQVLDPYLPNHAFSFLTGDQSPSESFGELADVAGDEDGNLYVVDTGNATVLKYDDAGELDQRVELNAAPGSSGYLGEPIAASASARRVYVIDHASAKIVTFELDQ